MTFENSGPFLEEALVLENRLLSQDTFLLTLESPNFATSAKPGQFVKARVWAEPANGGTPMLDRPFSIHRLTKDRQGFSLLFRVVGPGSRLLSQAVKGAKVKITGPLGCGWPDSLTEKPTSLYLVGGGIGLAPLAFAADWLGPDKKICVFYGERQGALQVPEKWLASWAGRYEAAVEDGSGYGRSGLVTGPLAEALQAAPAPILACGPAPMLAAVAALGKKVDVPVWVSMEADMACGLGVCLTCSVPLKNGERLRVCREGPIIDGQSVDWDALTRRG